MFVGSLTHGAIGQVKLSTPGRFLPTISGKVNGGGAFLGSKRGGGTWVGAVREVSTRQSRPRHDSCGWEPLGVELGARETESS